MTSLSTKAMLLKLEKNGKVVRFKPRLRPYEKEVRCLFLSPAMSGWLMKKADTKTAQAHKDAIKGHLAQFVKGEAIDNKGYMKELAPFEGIWEFRPFFTPVCRIFGGFILQDCFIATHQMSKADLDKHGYDAAKKRCTALWNKILPGIAFLQSKHFDDLVFKGVEKDERKKNKKK